MNAHSCNLLFGDPAYRRALAQADLIYLDGNGPRLAAWLTGDRLPPRMTGADWIHDLCALAQREGFRLYFLGAHPGVAKEAAGRLRRARRDILLLAMSSPKQGIWMARSGPELDIPIIWAAGGVLNYASGRIRRAPLWMRRLGLEWLGGWWIELRRLTRRYLVGISVFLARAATQAFSRRLHPRSTT